MGKGAAASEPCLAGKGIRMAQSGVKQQQPARISGQTIINELIRNMELGRLEMGYSILVPCVFSVYLHPDDFARADREAHAIDSARRNPW